MTVNETLLLQIDDLGGASVLGTGKFSVICPICKSITREIIFTQSGRGSFDVFAECGCPIRQVVSGLRRAVAAETGNKNGHEPAPDVFNEPRYTTTERAKDERTIFPLLTFKQLCELPPPKWQVQDFFLEQSLVQVYGETGNGKSLALWDMACSICAGVESWFGRAIVNPGPIIWINADGGLGLTLRAKAWAEAHGVEEMKYPLLTLMGAVHLNRADQIGHFRRQIMEMDEQPCMVFFDTQSRCMAGGRENDADEMTLVTEGLHRLKADVKCSVIPIHHTDKTGQWERGSGVVKNESDTQIRISKDEDSGIFTVRCKKARDHPPFEDFYFRVKPVLDSVIVEQHNAPPHRTDERKDEGVERVFEAIRAEPSIEISGIVTVTELSDATVRRAAKILVNARRVMEAPKMTEGSEGRRPRGYWAYPPREEPE